MISIETLLHYTCHYCQQWWSFATTDGYEPKKVYCMHCGKLQPEELKR